MNKITTYHRVTYLFSVKQIGKWKTTCKSNGQCLFRRPLYTSVQKLPVYETQENPFVNPHFVDLVYQPYTDCKKFFDGLVKDSVNVVKYTIGCHMFLKCKNDGDHTGQKHSTSR